MKNNNNFEWDVKLGDEIEFFDPTLSYELTGYRPIDEERGLDFRPEWFTKARDTKLEDGRYCDAIPHSKKYSDFWDEEYERCNKGYTVNGYTLTGDNYFFLNYYILPSLNIERAGAGREETFPEFFSKQYEYFHYVDLCERLNRDVIALKARGVGFSEIASSLAVRPYSTIPKYKVLLSAYSKNYIEKLLEKVWLQLDNLNQNTEDGMRHARTAINTLYKKRASIKTRQGEEYGWGSQIEGVIADKPSNLRGDRPSRLFFEESGSDKCLMKKYIQSKALVFLSGRKTGTRFVWGTGGDSGPALEGLTKMFNNPKAYGGLPYKHNYTTSGEYVYSAFFIPAFTFVSAEGFIDERGVTNTRKAIDYYNNERNLLLDNPTDYITNCAEYCFTPEEALALEGDNIFNKYLLGEQKVRMSYGLGLKPIAGRLEYTFKDNIVSDETRDSVKFIPDNKSKLLILEHPQLDENGCIPDNLYVGGIDGIDLGQEDTSEFTDKPSDYCIVIKKRIYGSNEPKLVAIYKDRPQRIIEAHRMTIKLLMYYNCKAMLEKTRVSILQYMKGEKVAHKLLMEKPDIATASREKNRRKIKTNIEYGVQATTGIIEHYLQLIADYIEDYSQHIWFDDVIDQCGKYSYENKKHFDIIAAWGMAELGDEDLSLVGKKIKGSKKNEKVFDLGYYTDSNGIKRFGVIPGKYKQETNYTFYGFTKN